MLLEHIGQFGIRQRLFRVLGIDKLLDQRTHRRARCTAAGFRAQTRAKKVFELERALRRSHVLGRGHAADGGFVQTQLVGNIAQHQRAHGQLTMHKEVLLPLHDGFGHPQDGVEALLNVLDEPARLLQALLQRGMSFAAFVTAQHAGVDVMYTQLGHDFGIELHRKVHPARAGSHRAHDDIGHHDIALHVDKATPRTGLKAGDQRDGLAQLLFASAAQAGKLAQIAPRQQVHGLSADGLRQQQAAHMGRCRALVLGFTNQIAQLQLQAFGQIARAHAHGLQALQQLERNGKVLLQLLALLQIVTGQALRQLLQRIFEVSIVAERLDEKAQRRRICRAQMQAQRLMMEKVAQALVLTCEINGIGLVITIAVVRGAAGRWRIPLAAGLAAPFAVLAVNAVGFPVQGFGCLEVKSFRYRFRS